MAYLKDKKLSLTNPIPLNLNRLFTLNVWYIDSFLPPITLALVTESQAMNDHVRVMWEWYMIRLADGSQCQYLPATGQWSGVKCIALITLQHLHNGGRGRTVKWTEDMWTRGGRRTGEELCCTYDDGRERLGKIKTQNIIMSYRVTMYRTQIRSCIWHVMTMADDDTRVFMTNGSHGNIDRSEW